MKKLITLCLLFIMILSQGFGQSNPSEELKLTESQQAQYLQIQNDQKEQMTAIASLRSSDPDKYYAQRNEIFEASDKKMKALFNETQWDVYDKLRKQRNSLLNIKPKSN